MTQQNPNPTFNFELTLEEANIILAALQEVPAKLCNPISEKIKTQAQKQIDATQAEQTSAVEKLSAEAVE